MAVVVRNGRKQFGQTGSPVLSNFQLNVEPGTIYGLLGPSGCGKTTVLSCLVGLAKLDSGQVFILGQTPGEKGSSIPGQDVGYMPQEAALYPNLKITEILSHFGGIYGMCTKEITERTQFLFNFLQISDTSRLIRTLSGGELRRVSLAVTMLHQPPILILDEPTAGLDPELRAKIWEYLHALVQNEGKTTVIITTQYIPESAFCDRVGIMRQGRVLAEDSPQSMLSQFGTNSLENVFLTLCKLDEDRKNLPKYVESSCQSIISDDNQKNVLLHSVKTLTDKGHGFDMEEEDSSSCSSSSNPRHQRHKSDFRIISTLVKKTILRQIRVPANVFLLLFIPVLLIVLINSIVGTAPTYYSLGLISKDWSNLDGSSVTLNSSLPQLCNTMRGSNASLCDGGASETEDPLRSICAFLNEFPTDKVHWIPTTTDQEALGQVQVGDWMGFVTFPGNFTNHFRDRLIFRKNAEPETVQGSTVSFRLDMSNSVYSGLLRKLILTSYSKFLQNSAAGCGGDPRQAQLPLKFHSIYPGDSDGLGWSPYIQPASIILIMSVLSSAPGMLTAIEKRLGYIDRDYVAGVKFRHLVASTLIHGSIVIILQLITTFTFLPLVYGMRSEGPWILVLLLVYLSSLCGVATGFFWGMNARHEMDVVMVLLGLNIAYIGGGGSMWPMEGIPFWYRNLCYMFPVTMPIQTLRSIIHRGWDFDHSQIIVGFGATLAWILAPILVTGIIYKSRGSR